MPKVYHRELGWTLERPCVFHTADAEIECYCDEPGTFEYDVTIKVAIYPGAPAYTPRGEYGPIDPPEPPAVEIRSVTMGDSTTPFPWPLTPEEEEKITELVLTEEP